MKRKKIKMKSLMEETPKRKRGRPRKEKAVMVTPKKRGRPRKVVETKKEAMRKIAKLGKRKYKKAIEEMAIEKINKKVRRKNGSFGNGDGIAEVVSVKNFGFRDEDIVAGPNKMPEGQRIFLEKEAKSLAKPTPKEKIPKLPKTELNRYIKRLKDRGIKPMNIKVIENTPQYFRIEFNDGANGLLITCGHVKGWEL